MQGLFWMQSTDPPIQIYTIVFEVDRWWPWLNCILISVQKRIWVKVANRIYFSLGPNHLRTKKSWQWTYHLFAKSYFFQLYLDDYTLIHLLLNLLPVPPNSLSTHLLNNVLLFSSISASARNDLCVDSKLCLNLNLWK